VLEMKIGLLQLIQMAESSPHVACIFWCNVC
jgi:hypothetical protein